MPRRQQRATDTWAPAWDSMTLLGLERLTNKDEPFNCVGITNKNNRCQCPIAKADIFEAFCILRQLPRRSLDVNTLDEDLKTLANTLLCARFHRFRIRPGRIDNKDQVDEVVEKWRRIIVRENARDRARFDRRRASSNGLDQEAQRNERARASSPPTRRNREHRSVAREPSTGTIEAPRMEATPDAPRQARQQPDRPADAAPDETSSPSPTEEPTASDTSNPPQQPASPRTDTVPGPIPPPPPFNLSDAQMQRRRDQLRDNSCPICLDNFTDPCETPCGHVFCSGCATEWLENNQNCPSCRRTTEAGELALLWGWEELLDLSLS